MSGTPSFASVTATTRPLDYCREPRHLWLSPLLHAVLLMLCSALLHARRRVRVPLSVCLPALSSCLGVESVAPAFQKTPALPTPARRYQCPCHLSPSGHVLARPLRPPPDDPAANLPSSIFLTAHQTDFQVSTGPPVRPCASHSPPASCSLPQPLCYADYFILTSCLFTNTTAHLGYTHHQNVHPSIHITLY